MQQQQQKYTLLLTKLECLVRSAEASSHDEVYVKIRPNGDPALEQVHFFDNPLSMDANGDALRFVDVSIDATYLSTLQVLLCDKDGGADADDNLGDMVITRDDPLEGQRETVQHNSPYTTKYKVFWRVIGKPIPTVRILGIKCAHSSTGCNDELIKQVAATTAKCAELASEAMSHVKTPRGIAMSKGFAAVADWVEVLAAVKVWKQNLREGKDDIYLQHVDAENGEDKGGPFWPADGGVVKMDEEEQFSFQDDFQTYYRFPLDRGPVTISIREGDRFGLHASLGSITIDDAAYAAQVDMGAVVVPALNYLTRGNGQGALYYVCYSVGMEDWSRPALDIPQGDYPPTADKWTPWAPLGGSETITSAPALVSQGAGKLTCLARGPSGQLLSRSFSDGAWKAWSDSGGVMAGAPAAVSWAANRIDVVIRGMNNNLWQICFEDGKWLPYHDVGNGKLASSPAITSWAPGRLDVFAQGLGGELSARCHPNWEWKGKWEPIGGKMICSPAAVSWGQDRIDVVVLGPACNLWHIAWDVSKWTAWGDLGPVPTATSPALCSRQSGTLDLFITTTRGTVAHRTYAGGRWSDGWVELDLGTQIQGSPAAAASGNRIDLVALGMDNKIHITTRL